MAYAGGGRDGGVLRTLLSGEATHFFYQQGGRVTSSSSSTSHFFFTESRSVTTSGGGVGHSKNQGKLSTNMKQIGQKYFLMGLQQQFTWLLCFANPGGAKGGLTKEVAKLNLSK